MGLFDHFPYTNFHEINLMWIMQALKEIETTIEQFVAINSLKYADPIQWNITSQYEKNTIVIDPQTGTAYISVQPVPNGVIITNTDYWSVVFDLSSFVVRAARNFTDKFEEETTLTATFPSSINDWIIWGDVLYRVISPIVAGDQYVDGSNIVHFTAEDVIGHIQDLNTSDKSNLVAAINEVLQTLINTAGDLDNLNTSDKSNLVAAINENVAHIINQRPINVKDYGTTGDGITDDYDIIQELINNYDYLYFPAGTYYIGGRILQLITSNKVFIGDNATILYDYHGLCFAEYTNQNWATGYDGVHDVVLDGINFRTTSSMSRFSITLAHCKNIVIRNCKFYHPDLADDPDQQYHHAIELNSSYNVVIDNCYFTGDCLSEAINIDHAYAGGIPSIGVHDDTIPSHIIITNTIFDNVWQAIGNHATNNTKDGEFITIENCTISNTSGNDAIHFNNYNNVYIHNCDITGGGILLKSTKYVRISNNRIASVNKNCIEYIVTDSNNLINTEFLSIVNNTLSGNYRGINGTNGIYTTIKDNIINTWDICIREALADYTDARNNILINESTSSHQVLFINNCNNSFYDCYIINRGSGADTAISGNDNIVNVHNAQVPNQTAATTNVQNNKVLLAANVNITSGTITLSDDLTKYDALLILGGATYGLIMDYRGKLHTGNNYYCLFDSGKATITTTAATTLTVSSPNTISYVIGVLF